jgi:flagellar basal-body rod modification protein FlgD
MNPLDNAQMTSQIAQINTVTGIQQLNQTMESMSAQFNSLQVMQGTALIGRNVMTEGSTLAVADKAGKGGFELASAATKVKVEVMTAGGQVIETMDLGAKAAGRHTFEWDASKYTGSTEGLQFRVSAVNGSTKIDSTSLALSKVTAAGAEDGQLVLTLANGKTINYSQIKALV